MRTMLSLLPGLAAIALCAAAVHPIAAQQTAATDHVGPVARHAAVILADAPRTVAVYRVGASRDVGMLAEVTVADSAGALVASFRLPGERTARPMLVVVLDDDLMLQAETPSGVLTLLLARQNDPEAVRTVTGRWWLGKEQGELRERVVR
jgi:hypothetical protein